MLKQEAWDSRGCLCTAHCLGQAATTHRGCRKHSTSSATQELESQLAQISFKRATNKSRKEICTENVILCPFWENKNKKGEPFTKHRGELGVQKPSHADGPFWKLMKHYGGLSSLLLRPSSAQAKAYGEVQINLKPENADPVTAPKSPSTHGCKQILLVKRSLPNFPSPCAMQIPIAVLEFI